MYAGDMINMTIEAPAASTYNIWGARSSTGSMGYWSGNGRLIVSQGGLEITSGQYSSLIGACVVCSVCCLAACMLMPVVVCMHTGGMRIGAGQLVVETGATITDTGLVIENGGATVSGGGLGLSDTGAIIGSNLIVKAVLTGSILANYVGTMMKVGTGMM